MHTIPNHITVEKNIQFGTPVFLGSREPVQSLFWHLEKGISLDNFLLDFPSVNRKHEEGVIEWTARRFETPEIILDETFIG